MTQFTEPTASPPTSDVSHRRAWVWPAIVIGMLGSQIVICLVAFIVATSDPSQAVVRDYHRKALAWDEHMAERRAGEALGWQTQLVVAQAADMLGDRTIRLSLKDAQGEPLTGVVVGVSAFHLARASQVIQADLKEAVPGEYVTQIKMRKNGKWQLDFIARRGDELYPFTLQQQVGADGWRSK